MAHGKYTYADQPGCLSFIATNLLIGAWMFGPFLLFSLGTVGVVLAFGLWAGLIYWLARA